MISIARWAWSLDPTRTVLRLPEAAWVTPTTIRKPVKMQGTETCMMSRKISPSSRGSEPLGPSRGASPVRQPSHGGLKACSAMAFTHVSSASLRASGRCLSRLSSPCTNERCRKS